MEVRYGITRTVFVFNNFVVKVPTIRYGWDFFLRGLLANISEGRLWDLDYRREFICPVRRYSRYGLFLVMEKAEVLPDTFDISKIDIDPMYKGDDKPDNYGYFKDRIVKIDYA